MDARQLLVQYVERLEREIEGLRDIVGKRAASESPRREDNRIEVVLKGDVISEGDIDFIPEGGHLLRVGGCILLRYRNVQEFDEALQVFVDHQTRLVYGGDNDAT